MEAIGRYLLTERAMDTTIRGRLTFVMTNRSRAERQAARERPDPQGFTLLELLIVIAGILTAVVVFALGCLAGQGAGGVRHTDMTTAEAGALAYGAHARTQPFATRRQRQVRNARQSSARNTSDERTD